MMKNKKVFSYLYSQLIIIFLCLPISSIADDIHRPLVPLSSILDYSKGDGWSGSVGLKTQYQPVFDGAGTYVLEIKPDIIIQWRSAKQTVFLEISDIDGAEIGWRGLLQDNWLMQAGLRHETVLTRSLSD